VLLSGRADGRKEMATNEKELYWRKCQAQLDEWRADVDKLRTMAAGARADAQIEINKHVTELDTRMHEAGAGAAAAKFRE